jgi:hypothetical protein
MDGRTIFKGKDKIDLILEPMQVMVQLSILSFLPTGTKISIYNNIVKLQPPTTIQGLVRWYNNDSKDDLYYLFKAVLRYHKLYKKQNREIFDQILAYAEKGIDQLTKTYSECNKNSILQTLGLYKSLIKSDPTKLLNNGEEEDIFNGITGLYNKRQIKIIYNLLVLIDNEKNQNYKEDYISSLQIFYNPINSEIKRWICEKIVY